MGRERMGEEDWKDMNWKGNDGEGKDGKRKDGKNGPEKNGGKKNGKRKYLKERKERIARKWWEESDVNEGMERRGWEGKDGKERMAIERIGKGKETMCRKMILKGRIGREKMGDRMGREWEGEKCEPRN